jgi:hypothetical protein
MHLDFALGFRRRQVRIKEPMAQSVPEPVRNLVRRRAPERVLVDFVNRPGGGGAPVRIGLCNPVALR